MKILNHFYQKKANPLLVILFLIAASFMPLISNAQHWMSQFGHLENYYQIKAATEVFFSEDTSRRSNKVYDYKGFNRYVTFMDPRVDQDGSLATYSEAFNTSREEILNSTDNNRIFAEWKPLGPSHNISLPEAQSYLGLITSVWVDTSNFTTIYAGSNSGGLFVSNNGGNSWNCLTDQYMVTGVESIEKNARQPNVIYIGTGFYTWGRNYGVGVLKSTNNGLSWSNTGLNVNTFQYENDYKGINFVVSKTIQHPTHPDTLIALVNFDVERGAKLMRTFDGGDHWLSKVNLPQGNTSFLSKIEMCPSNPAFMITCGRKILTTHNYWENSIDITDLFLESNERLERSSISFHPTDPNKILLLIHKVTTDTSNIIETKDILLSQDGGISFNSIIGTNTLNGISFYKMEIEWSKAMENTFYIGGLRVMGYRILSNNTLEDLNIPATAAYYHADIRELKTFIRKKPNSSGGYTFEGFIYHGNDGGITIGTENITNGVNWDDISGNGLNITQFYGIGIPENNTDLIVGGTQDGNYCRFERGDWTLPMKGDAADAVFNHNHQDSVYLVTFMTEYYGMLSIDGGRTWPTNNVNAQNKIFISDSRRNDAPIEMSTSNPRRLYIGGKDVWRSLNGRDFQKISNFINLYPLLFSSDLKTIREASNGTTIYAGLDSPYWSQVQKTRLFKTTNGGAGNNWTDITPTIADTPTAPGCNLENVGIFDIAVNPNNPDQIYLAVNRNVDGKKVFRYTAGEWINMSEGLPNVPVNCIRYYKGTDLNELFAGTDLGVYYRNDIINKWIPFGTGLPLVSVSDLEINYATKEMVAATFGRGIYKINLCFDAQQNSPVYVEETQTWGDRALSNDVFINAGAVLTITGIVEMPPTRHIYIRKGGLLILNGGTITNACKDELWGGVIIYGTSTGPQTLNYQGMIEIINNGTIENAEIGIHCLNATEEDGGIVISSKITGGGIVLANKAWFINNAMAVVFEKYTNSSASRFSLSNFVTNDELYADATFQYFVRMNEVNGITFTGCSFSENRSSTLIERGKGIYSKNSFFMVDQYCATPCTLPQKSSFNNLRYGIYTTGQKGGRTFSVKNTDFNFNERGIFAVAVDLMSIKNNWFFMKGIIPSQFKPEVASGIYLDNCTGYIIEENELRTTVISQYFTSYGIYINNSGEANNTIYKNKFFNNTYGITAQNKNRNIDGSAGLRLNCNKFNNVKLDIAVIKTGTTVTGMGIAESQGTNGVNCEYPAGNLFSNPVPPLDYYSIHNAGGSIVYTHHNISNNNKVRPSVVTEATVTRIPTQHPYFETCCPSHISGGGGTGSIDGTTLAYKSEADTIIQTLATLIDDGDTGEKVIDVNSAAPAEALLIRNDLLQTSPYVSDTVLKAAIIREELLNNAMLRDIMVANPHSAKSEDLMQDMDMRLVPMPEYMKDEILEGMFVLSSRELMEAKRDMDITLYNYGFNRLLSISLTDTTPVSADTLMALLAADGSSQSFLKQAWLLLEDGDTTSALNKVETIPTLITLTTTELAELSEQQALIQWLAANPVIDSTSLEALSDLSESSSSSVSASVRSMMIANNLMEYNEPYLIPDLTKSIEARKPSLPDNNASETIKVYPNPGKDFVTLEYSLGDNYTSGLFEIIDQTGKIVKRGNLGRKTDQIVLDTRDLTRGYYYISLITGNNSVASTRFVISK